MKPSVVNPVSQKPECLLARQNGLEWSCWSGEDLFAADAVFLALEKRPCFHCFLWLRLQSVRCQVLLQQPVCLVSDVAESAMSQAAAAAAAAGCLLELLTASQTASSRRYSSLQPFGC